MRFSNVFLCMSANTYFQSGHEFYVLTNGETTLFFMFECSLEVCHLHGPHYDLTPCRADSCCLCLSQLLEQAALHPGDLAVNPRRAVCTQISVALFLGFPLNFQMPCQPPSLTFDTIQYGFIF